MAIVLGNLCVSVACGYGKYVEVAVGVAPFLRRGGEAGGGEAGGGEAGRGEAGRGEAGGGEAGGGEAGGEEAGGGGAGGNGGVGRAGGGAARLAEDVAGLAELGGAGGEAGGGEAGGGEAGGNGGVGGAGGGAARLAEDVAGLAELILANDPRMMFTDTLTGDGMGYFFRKPWQMLDRAFYLADFIFPLAEWFQGRDVAAFTRICNATFACFMVSYALTESALDVAGVPPLCQYLYCATSDYTPDETGLRLLGAGAAKLSAPANSDQWLAIKVREWARRCLRFGCLQVRRRLMSACASCGRDTGFHVLQPGGVLTGKQHIPLWLCGGGCRTAYCDKICQKAHWRTGGHRGLCCRKDLCRASAAVNTDTGKDGDPPAEHAGV